MVPPSPSLSIAPTELSILQSGHSGQPQVLVTCFLRGSNYQSLFVWAGVVHQPSKNIEHNLATELSTHCTGWGGHLFRRFCKQISGSSPGRYAVLQLPCGPSKQGELSENLLQNLRNNWPPHPVYSRPIQLNSLQHLHWALLI